MRQTSCYSSFLPSVLPGRLHLLLLRSSWTSIALILVPGQHFHSSASDLIRKHTPFLAQKQSSGAIRRFRLFLSTCSVPRRRRFLRCHDSCSTNSRGLWRAGMTCGLFLGSSAAMLSDCPLFFLTRINHKLYRLGLFSADSVEHTASHLAKESITFQHSANTDGQIRYHR